MGRGRVINFINGRFARDRVRTRTRITCTRRMTSPAAGRPTRAQTPARPRLPWARTRDANTLASRRHRAEPRASARETSGEGGIDAEVNECSEAWASSGSPAILHFRMSDKDSPASCSSEISGGLPRSIRMRLRHDNGTRASNLLYCLIIVITRLFRVLAERIICDDHAKLYYSESRHKYYVHKTYTEWINLNEKDL